jgi:hypothetical protein
VKAGSEARRAEAFPLIAPLVIIDLQHKGEDDFRIKRYERQTVLRVERYLKVLIPSGDALDESLVSKSLRNEIAPRAAQGHLVKDSAVDLEAR